MGWMGKRGALTSLLWKVMHLGLLSAVSLAPRPQCTGVMLSFTVVSQLEQQAHTHLLTTVTAAFTHCRCFKKKKAHFI